MPVVPTHRGVEMNSQIVPGAAALAAVSVAFDDGGAEFPPPRGVPSGCFRLRHPLRVVDAVACLLAAWAARAERRDLPAVVAYLHIGTVLCHLLRPLRGVGQGYACGFLSTGLSAAGRSPSG